MKLTPPKFKGHPAFPSTAEQDEDIRKLYRAGNTVPQIMALYAFPRYAVLRIVGRTLPPLTADDREDILRRFAAGETYASLARRFGRQKGPMKGIVEKLIQASNEPPPQVYPQRRCSHSECRQWFDPPSRFRFICDKCHDRDEWRSPVTIHGVRA